MSPALKPIDEMTGADLKTAVWCCSVWLGKIVGRRGLDEQIINAQGI